MNQHLKNAENFYKFHGQDFKDILGRYLCDGFVLCLDDVFAIGFYSKYSDPTVPSKEKDCDTVFVTYFSGKPMSLAQIFIRNYKYFSFQRLTKNSTAIKLIEIKKFNR
jgi:hypothetical protein